MGFNLLNKRSCLASMIIFLSFGLTITQDTYFSMVNFSIFFFQVKYNISNLEAWFYELETRNSSLPSSWNLRLSCIIITILKLKSKKTTHSFIHIIGSHSLARSLTHSITHSETKRLPWFLSTSTLRSFPIWTSQESCPYMFLMVSTVD